MLMEHNQPLSDFSKSVFAAGMARAEKRINEAAEASIAAFEKLVQQRNYQKMMGELRFPIISNNRFHN
jgi:hypothetical protein